MPGLAGIISRRPTAQCEAELRAMLASMQHEAFYATGTHSVPELGIYCGWLAHPHSFASHHSGNFSRDSISLAFSGECFDDNESTQPGSAGGPKLSWIVDRYEQSGERFVESLNGLFSGLLIDRQRQQAFLFNDRYGIERLYFHETTDTTYFASEAKALLRVLPALRSFDPTGVAQFLAYNCTLEWQTLFRGVSLAPGGTRWRITPDGVAHKGRYFLPEQWESQTTLTAAEYDAAFSETFRRILPRYVGNEEGLGLSLTGGLDTRMVMACLPPAQGKITSYTFAGLKDNTLDGRIAAKIAGLCGIDHCLLRIKPDFLTGFAGYLDRTVYISDGTAGATGAHEIYFNTAARALATTRLTGNFGSEVLRGMSTFKAHPVDFTLLSPETQRAVTAASHYAAGPRYHPVSFATFREIPWNLFGTMAAGKSQVTFRTPYLDNELVKLAFRVPAHLRTSPMPALRLIQRHHPELAAIATDRGLIGEARGPAHMARRIFAEVSFKLDYMHKEGLPSALSPFAPFLNALDHTGLLGLHKFLAYRRWFQNELNPQIASVLSDRRTREMPFWDPKSLEPMLAEHVGGRRNRVKELNAILTLEAIDRLLLGAPSSS